MDSSRDRGLRQAVAVASGGILGAGRERRCAASAAGGSALGAPLGIHGRNASPYVPGMALIRRFAYHNAARELLPGERALQGCTRWLRGGLRAVQLLHHPKHRSGAFGGLQRCGSVWQCPLCATKISERRRLELREGVERWRDRGGELLLITYTVCHKWADDLKSTLGGLLKARKGLLSGKAAIGFNRRYQVAGRVRALETTHGRNGWHPHVHELTFVGAGCDQAAILGELRERWARRVAAAGLRDVNSHGVDVAFSDLDVGDYIAKFGRERTWDVEHEMTKAVVKAGRLGSRGPIGLLADYLAGDQGAGALWRQYARAFKGNRQLTWSDGLRELLGLGVEQSDQQVAEEQREDAVLMDELEREEWKTVLGNDARAELLDVLSRGSVAELREFLNAIGIER